MTNRYLFICLLLLSVTAWSQTDNTNKRYIEVIGSAETEIDPNIIVLSCELREYDENKVKVTMEKIEKDFQAAVTQSNIPKESVRLSNLTANAYKPKRRDRNSYSQKTFEITFSRTQDVLNFLDKLSNVQIDNFWISKLSHTDIQKFRLETKVAALKAAEMKAEVLLTSVGSKKGKAIQIEEVQEQPEISPTRKRGIYFNSNASLSRMSVQDMDDSDEVPLKKIQLRFEIMVRFEIE